MVGMIKVGLFANLLSSQLDNDEWVKLPSWVSRALSEWRQYERIHRLISFRHTAAQPALSVGGDDIKEEWLTAMSKQPDFT